MKPKSHFYPSALSRKQAHSYSYRHTHTLREREREREREKRHTQTHTKKTIVETKWRFSHLKISEQFARG